MAESHDPVRDGHRLRAESAQHRAQAIQAQLSVGHTFCKMVETELDFGRVDVAHTLLGKVRHIADTVRNHLDEPRHVPSDQLDQLRDQLTQFELRVLQVEQQVAAKQ